MFRKGFDKAAESDEKTEKEIHDRPYKSSQWPDRCRFCYGDSYAELSTDASLPSTYYNEMKKAKRGDPVCGECLIIIEYLTKVEQAKKYPKPSGYGYGGYHDGGYFRRQEPETVRGKRSFAKKGQGAASTDEETAD